jgi:hypothetical protein
MCHLQSAFAILGWFAWPFVHLFSKLKPKVAVSSYLLSLLSSNSTCQTSVHLLSRLWGTQQRAQTQRPMHDAMAPTSFFKFEPELPHQYACQEPLCHLQEQKHSASYGLALG